MFLSFIIIFILYIPHGNFIISSEQKIFNEILYTHNLPCHLQSSRIKTFNSAIQKMNVLNINNIYDLHDLIAFRFVFYTKEDLLRFYHYIKLEKTVMYIYNYLNNPKKNGYSAFHLRYKNDYIDCPIVQLECQLYLIEDYYDSIYGKSKYYKNYSIFF